MSRIVFAWELGSSYGHISRLLPFARKLKKRGHEVLLVLRELQNVGNLSVDELPVLQAPLWIYPPKGLSEPPLNYSEILLRYGYLDAGGLAGLVQAWRSLFTLHCSDVVVADRDVARDVGVAVRIMPPPPCLPHAAWGCRQPHSVPVLTFRRAKRRC